MNAPALSLAETCRRKVGRAELVEIFECLEFFWILVMIWPIDANLESAWLDDS